MDIEELLVDRRFRNGLEVSRAVPGADYYSSHRLFIGKVRIKFRKVNHTPGNVGLDVNVLKSGVEIQDKLNMEIGSGFHKLSDRGFLFRDVGDQREFWGNSLGHYAETAVPRMELVGGGGGGRRDGCGHLWIDGGEKE